VAVCEEFQDFFGVVADGGELYALLFESGIRALQLDQLPFAEGSPVGGAEEEKNRAVGAFESFEAIVHGRIRRGRKSWGLFGQRRGRWDMGPAEATLIVSSSRAAVDGNSVAEMAGDFCSLRLKRVHHAVGVVVESDFLRQGRFFEALGEIR